MYALQNLYLFFKTSLFKQVRLNLIIKKRFGGLSVDLLGMNAVNVS